MFRHFIFCRYNIGLYSGNVYSIPNPDKWMEQRLPKFKRLIESLKAQSKLNFIFVVFMDKDTPEKYKQQILDMSVQPFSFSIAYVKGADLFDIGRKYLSNFTPDGWVITSRIDSDDAYLPEFVKTIQQSFTEKEQLLDVRGYQIDENTGAKYATGRNKCNSPFISLIEKNATAKTVFQMPHAELFQHYSAKMASENPMYIQYIHNHNISNKISGIKYD